MDERDRPRFGRGGSTSYENMYQNDSSSRPDDDDFDAEAFVRGDAAGEESAKSRMIGILITGVAFLFMPFLMFKVIGVGLLIAGLLGMFGKGETFERLRSAAMFGQIRVVIGVVIAVMALIFMVSNWMIGSKVMEEAEHAQQEALQDRQGN